MLKCAATSRANLYLLADRPYNRGDAIEIPGVGLASSSRRDGLFSELSDELWQAHRSLHGIVRPDTTTKHGPTQGMVVTRNGITHTLAANLSAGGYIDSWIIDHPLVGSGFQLLNRGDSYTRGIQARAEWVDTPQGDLRRHNPVQGGNRFSIPGKTTAVAAAYPGSPIYGHQVIDREAGSKQIVTTSGMLEFDPDGSDSVLGCSSDHDGDATSPVLWTGATAVLNLIVNHEVSIPGAHLLTYGTYLPFEKRSGWFDVGVAAPICVRRWYNQVRAFDAVFGTDTLLATSTVGSTAYLANYRCYSMDDIYRKADDENPAEKPVSSIPSGIGGIAYVDSVTGFAIVVARAIDKTIRAKTEVRLDGLATPTCWEWLQNDTSGTGHDSEAFGMLGMPKVFTNRHHPATQARTIGGAWMFGAHWVITDSWEGAKRSIRDLYNRGLL